MLDIVVYNNGKLELNVSVEEMILFGQVLMIL
jgi:hypothetical protein